MLSCYWILAHELGTLSDLPATGICFSFFDSYLRLGGVGSVWFTPCKDLCVAGLSSLMSFLHGLWSEASITLYHFPFKVQILLTYLFHFYTGPLVIQDLKLSFNYFPLNSFLVLSCSVILLTLRSLCVYISKFFVLLFFFFNECGTYFNM